MSRYLDYKCTIWQRITISDDKTFESIKSDIEENLSPDDIYNKYESTHTVTPITAILETEELMTPFDNDGEATIELYDEGHKLVMTNVREKIDYELENQSDINVGSILEKVEIELKRSKELHPNYPKDNYKRFAILAEETGEVSKSLLDGETKEETITELIQVAAMAVKMVEALQKEE